MSAAVFLPEIDSMEVESQEQPGYCDLLKVVTESGSRLLMSDRDPNLACLEDISMSIDREFSREQVLEPLPFDIDCDGDNSLLAEMMSMSDDAICDDAKPQVTREPEQLCEPTSVKEETPWLPASPVMPQVRSEQSSLPMLPMFDTSQHQHQHQHQIRSRTPSSCSSGSDDFREVSLQRQADYIRAVIESRVDKPMRTTAKVKVHEVILVVLLHPKFGDPRVQLDRILVFCDSNGVETDAQKSSHFKAIDTEAMGRLWQKIKRNRKKNYDTFARAMRVRRERSTGFFEYLEAGKGKRKKIYKFGPTCFDEMRRLQKTLKDYKLPIESDC